jgi:hypothetical protein
MMHTCDDTAYPAAAMPDECTCGGPMNYTEWAEKHGLTMEVSWADTNPNMDDDAEWMAQASHYTCTLSVAGQDGTLSIPFSMGAAHTSEPELGDVLGAVASDAAGFENAAGFEDWASEYGYDTDSRKAERTYRAVKHQSERFMRFVGKSAYDELLWQTEEEN